MEKLYYTFLINIFYVFVLGCIVWFSHSLNESQRIPLEVNIHDDPANLK